MVRTPEAHGGPKGVGPHPAVADSALPRCLAGPPGALVRKARPPLTPPRSRDRRGIHSGARHNWARTVDGNLTRNLSKRNETVESSHESVEERLSVLPMRRAGVAPPSDRARSISNAVARLDGHALPSGAPTKGRSSGVSSGSE
jgi:hypothetical protein